MEYTDEITQKRIANFMEKSGMLLAKHSLELGITNYELRQKVGFNENGYSLPPTVDEKITPEIRRQLDAFWSENV